MIVLVNICMILAWFCLKIYSLSRNIDFLISKFDPMGAGRGDLN